MTAEGLVVDSWHAYPKIYAVGHRAVADLFTAEVIVEEKVDGSQFSFGVDHELRVRMRSKGAEIDVEAPEKMFGPAAETVERLAKARLLMPGWTYRAEYLRSPKHNSLAYHRIPVGHLMLFDIYDGHEKYLSEGEREDEAKRIGLECVRVLFRGVIGSTDQLLELLDTESVLGGQKVEGVVIKPAKYERFGEDKKVLMAKYVSEAFKEVHAKSWKKRHPAKADVVEAIIEAHRTEARWEKSIQRLRDSGEIEGSPKDIGLLIREIQSDVTAECKDEIKDVLWRWARQRVERGVVKGFPEFYKESLAREMLDGKADAGLEV